MDYIDDLVNKIRQLDSTNVSDNISTPVNRVVESQKIYFWIRLFLKEELTDLKIGDDIKITYLVSGENIDTKFICFGKKKLVRDSDVDTVTEYDPEDDHKNLCLMVDQDMINTRTDIPFIRTLFRNSRHYKHQLIRRSDLIFVNNRTEQNIEYADCSF